ncbi:MAG TPA: copper resistance protein CopC [Gemmatimonadaceae bacterium]|nr:copper resistance protein CopC [Gemmatimonadaceae bacterium]
MRRSRPPPNFAIVQSSSRHALIAACAVVALIATPVIAFAHARLVRSAPAANESLSAPPNGISLWFSERPELRFTSVQLLDSAGRAITLGAPSADADATGVVAAISAPLGVGRYTVVWRTAAADGHPSTGKFAFTVTSAPAAPPVVAPDDTARGSVSVRIDTVARRIPNSIAQPERPPAMPTAARWAELVAALTLIGALVVRLAVLPRADLPRETFIDASDRLRRLGHATLTLFALATLLRVAAESTLVMGDGESRLHAMLIVVRDTRWGHGWSFGAAGAVLAIVGLVAARRSISGWVVASVGAVLVCLGEALTGHAAASSRSALAIAADVTHVLGAGAWIGGLAALVVSVFPAIGALDQAQESRAGSRVVRAYHASAVECVAIVAISALVAAWLRLPALSALWSTTYGQILLIKVCVVLVVLAFGGYHWRSAVSVEWGTGTAGKFRRSAAAELVVGAIVVAITAVLISTPLPS